MRRHAPTWLSLSLSLYAVMGMVTDAMADPLATCPDIASYRSPAVLGAFEPAGLNGLWYEYAYIDVAQVGATCQTLNSTYDAASGVLSMGFKVDYGPVPFTIIEVYTPPNASAPGLYTKRAKMPGSQLVELPTVVVDVTRFQTAAESSSAPYDTMTLYSCINKLGIVVDELIFAGRTRAPGPGVLGRMQAMAKAQGVVWAEHALKPVNHSTCSDRD